MRWSIETVTGPAEEPLTLANARDHLRVDQDYEDAKVASYIVAARSHIERVTGCRFRPQTVRAWFDAWPEGDTLELHVHPVSAVDYIKYYDSANAEATLGGGVYDFDSSAFAPRAVLRSSQSWPGSQLRPSRGVACQLQAGWPIVPGDLTQALIFLVAHFYENPTMVLSGGRSVVLPFTFESLIEPWRLRHG